MDTSIHRYPLTILEHHLDTFGHMNHAVYLEILEEARWDLITNNGYGLKRVQETGLGPIILDVHISFRREIQLREKIIIETQFKSVEKKFATVAHEIKNERNEVCCSAEIKFGLFDIKTRKLIAPTPDWLKAIGAAP